jgi:hypothetical protein
MTLELVPLATMRFTTAEATTIPDTPRGTRLVVEVTDGVIEGERLRARQRGAAAADWLTLDARGIGTIDVRATMETDDGALLYVSYLGRLDLGGANPGTVYSTPLFDTGDERYRWLAAIQAVGKGTLDGNTLTYELYELR